ncbi:phosphodiesterase [Vibrio albus]|uniref:Phosphodiesterase n=1 Tax=Vibrio albus TaxID=2200953 RepID=A0A2U3B5X6_9VIBR|nr:HD domain-containing phosphohydrolase [Vibrio albus]PWI32172.1 phosphodiesterase [Vibrio albus]
MNVASVFHVNLREMITAIETSVSLVGIDDTNHGKRVGYMACQLGHELGYSQQDLQYLFELGMLHDIGVSSNHTHSNLVANFAWDNAQEHCDIGYQLLKDFSPLSHFAVPILYHHTPWSELNKKEIKPRDAMMANLVFLADRIDTYGAGHYGKDILIARHHITNTIVEKGSHYFAPEFIEAFLDIQQSESFWIALEDQHITRYVWDMSKEKSNTIISLEQLKQLSHILAYIVDQKSPFTAQHSAKVAELARYIAVEYGMTETQCDMIEIAGLLHDLGKLRTPDEILEKPGGLDELERAIMNQHSYETYEILRHITGLEDIANWASFHHEGLNGRGYPFHPNQNAITMEARIVAVADVFQALAQKRPYREGMPIEKILSILKEMTEQGKLDPAIVSLVYKQQSHCYEIAS